MVKDKLVEKIARVMFQLVQFVDDKDIDKLWESFQPSVRREWGDKADILLNVILSDPNIVEIDREAELPKNPIKVTSYLGLTDEEATTRQLESDCFVEVIQNQMLKAGWVLPKRGDDG